MSKLERVVKVLEDMVVAAEALDEGGVMREQREESWIRHEMCPKWDWGEHGPIYEAIGSVYTYCLGHLHYHDNPRDCKANENDLDKAKEVVGNLKLGSDRLSEMVRLFVEMYAATEAGYREEFDELHLKYNAIGDEMFGRDSWANHTVGYIFDQARNDLTTYPMALAFGEDFGITPKSCLEKAKGRIDFIYPCL